MWIRIRQFLLLAQYNFFLNHRYDVPRCSEEEQFRLNETVSLKYLYFFILEQNFMI